MSEAKFTPGPWRANDNKGNWLADKTEWTADKEGHAKDGTTTCVPVLARKVTVAMVVSEGWDDSAMEANARLIAAAPDMYAALKNLVAAIKGSAVYKSGDFFIDDMLVPATAALSRAEGK